MTLQQASRFLLEVAAESRSLSWEPRTVPRLSSGKGFFVTADTGPPCHVAASCGTGAGGHPIRTSQSDTNTLLVFLLLGLTALS